LGTCIAEAIVEPLSPLCDSLKTAIANVLNNRELAADAISTFARLVASHEKFHRPTFDAFAAHVISDQWLLRHPSLPLPDPTIDVPV
jgi:hypothetical protein